MTTITKLLVANRGEIARRIFDTARAMGIRTVAVHTDADAHLPFVAEADEAVRIGEGPASSSYLDAEVVLAAARQTGADAVHPGYGFLSENAAFARAVTEAGLVWVGPAPDTIAVMGDKAAARRLAAAHDVPVVPGYDGDDQADATFVGEAERIGVPLLVKAAAGGGGRGMRRVDDLAALPEALASARREAASAFGDPRLLLERYVLRPRHVEVQVLGDAAGTVLHLGARDCSVQRRHQKVVEETPPPGLPEATLAGLLDSAVRLASAVGYVGAGTVEYVVGQDGGYYFLEMNTRLQVEHPVTEATHEVDLVAWQLSIAQGEVFDPVLVGEDGAFGAGCMGAAIEVRIYAEDPMRDWMPAAGRLERLHLPSSEDVRVDAGYRDGDVVPSHYDSMLAKVIAWGGDRASALRRLTWALDGAWAPGVVTNLPLLRSLVRDAAFAAGDVHTGLLGERGLPAAPPANLERGALVATAWAWWQRRQAADWRDGLSPPAWQIGGPPEQVDRWAYLTDEVEVGWTPRADGLSIRIGEAAHAVDVLAADGDTLRLRVDGVQRTVRVLRAGGPGTVDDGDTVYVHLGDGEAMVRLVPRFPAPAGLEPPPGSCVAPTPGVVRAVHVAAGDTVVAGAPLVTLEAMKMEHHLTAPGAGTVAAVRCAVGQAVDGGALLVQLELDEAT
ncbi:MAG: ATP-grasp domain-containing protein [Alphaproteobacteria bacterium]|nr:ATP-grasp domain-containing protein [Alphaproteobacteria bacterium]